MVEVGRGETEPSSMRDEVDGRLSPGESGVMTLAKRLVDRDGRELSAVLSA